MKHYTRTLTIAGSDSGGGAGIQADLKTFSALGCFGMSAITALTAQNTTAVTGILEIDPVFVTRQIDAVLNDIGVDAVKIGMLSSPEIIAAVAEALQRHKVSHIVLDPVMVAKSGDKLLQDISIEALKTTLIPLAEIITPNIPEAEVLTGMQVHSRTQMEIVAKELLQLGPKAVLLKGGHFEDAESPDCLVVRDGDTTKTWWLEAKRVESPNTHGTGCTLSSAIAAHLAKGMDALSAVQAAKAYITNAIIAGAEYQIGHGHGPVHHFHALWQD
jgi:hydroxymethylpyrimidine/phosphomethylpyrimidine kinase